MDYFTSSTLVFVLAESSSEVFRREWTNLGPLSSHTAFGLGMQALALLGLGGLMFIVVRRRLLYLSRSQWWALPVMISFSLGVTLITSQISGFRLHKLFYLLTQGLLLVPKANRADAAQS